MAKPYDYGLTQTAAPAEEPVTTAVAKLHMRVSPDYDTEDDLIDIYIAAARVICENITHRQFVTATWAMTLRAFPTVSANGSEVLYLPRPSGISVTSLAYVDTDGEDQTLVDGTDYSTDFTTLVSTISPFYNTTWPSTRDQKKAVTVTYTAGYGAASAVPGNIKAAILMVTADQYEHRMLAHELKVIENKTVMLLLGPAIVPGVIGGDEALEAA